MNEKATRKNCANKKEMIKEMAKEIFNACAWRFGKPNHYREICKDIAEDLIELGYTKNKIPEGSVVLTETQYNMLLNNQSTVISIDEQLKKEFEYELKQLRKETAKEILQEIMSVETEEKKWLKNEPFVCYVKKMLNKIEELAKQFGVEVEE